MKLFNSEYRKVRSPRWSAVSTGFALGLSTLGLGGCLQGSVSDRPPIHIIQNMDFQQRADAQEEMDFFADRRGMRAPVPGTIAHDSSRLDFALNHGRNPDSGRLLDTLPDGLKLDRAFLARGQERYDIYCAPCHGEGGRGNGIVTLRGGGLAVPPPDFIEPRLTAMPLGHFYNVITHGVGEPPNQNMLSYAAQIPVRDRWAISAWVRTLQLHAKGKGAQK